MQNLDGKYAQYGHKESFYKHSIYNLWILIVVAHFPRKFCDVICDTKAFVALRHTSFQFQCSGSLVKWIMNVLWVPNLHHHTNTSFWSHDFFRECRIWKQIKNIAGRQQSLINFNGGFFERNVHWLYAKSHAVIIPFSDSLLATLRAITG